MIPSVKNRVRSIMSKYSKLVERQNLCPPLELEADPVHLEAHSETHVKGIPGAPV
jgi:hypothetical protein